MARVKLTEYKAKQLLYHALGKKYLGTPATPEGYQMPHNGPFVLKVDQGIKGRMKKGLVELEIQKDKLPDALMRLSKKGYSQFIIEPMVKHDPSQERYLSLERTREGIVVRYAKVGGIDIESMKDRVEEVILNSKFEYRNPKQAPNSNDQITQKISEELAVPINFMHQLLNFFERQYISFLEINPLVVKQNTSPLRGTPLRKRRIKSPLTRGVDFDVESKDGVFILDLAVEVDSTAEFFTKTWTSADIVEDSVKSPEELAIKKLNDQSQAALSFTLLNSEGLLWVLLSGGGASITIADEAYNMGFGKELANYGEYSGNPNDDETYEYTCNLIDSMMKSSRRRLMLIIGGGVANFTDIGKTFKGVIKALEKNKKRLKKKEIKIFVRRGGPNQKNGLKLMEKWLRENDMYGIVAGPELPLHEIMKLAINSSKKHA
ncbi:MAG: hypothetical protein O3B87_04715 [bacterium]|nr:hypothetical protein [bacterium]